ncbi:MAG: aldo/keto reductase [Prolixibacteraceae bacterium]|nr:aldo/keto reductase [Prolixibacteraceae bacterium]
MEYRKLGNSELELSAITFGAFAIGGWLWGGTKHAESIDAIHAAYDSGITSFDTAPVYGQGTSEKLIGEAIKGIPRDKIQILTKYGLRWDTNEGKFYTHSVTNEGKKIDLHFFAGKEGVITECENSLRRLGTDYIDLYQIHWPDTSTPIEETMEAIQQLIKEGKIRYAGVCNFPVKLMEEASSCFPLVSDQVPYSMVARDIEKDLVPYMIKENKSVIAYSPMQRGLLTGKIKPDHKFGEGDQRSSMPFYTKENIKRTNEFLEKIKPLAEKKNATLGQLVLRWTIEQPSITIALAGARNKEQAIQNSKATDFKLSKEELSFINKELNKLKLEL